MFEHALQHYCPAFGLMPDLAVLVSHSLGRDSASPPAHHWAWEPPPKSVDAVHEPEFVLSVQQRVQSQVNHPVVVSHDHSGRRVLQVLGCYIFLEQKNRCWRVYEWSYQSLGRMTLSEVPANNVVAQSCPWRWQWLQSLIRPLALEYDDWRVRKGHKCNPAAAARYSRWLVHTLEKKLRVDGLQSEISRQMLLDPWALKVASKFLRPHNMPNRALLADYNCVIARRSSFAKLESDGPQLIGLYGALCRVRNFPRTGEPVQRLRAYLGTNGVHPHTWIAIVNAPARLWLVLNRFYTGVSAVELLDLISCIDWLGFDQPPSKWLLEALLTPHGGPGSRYTTYGFLMRKCEQVWRHVVRLLAHIEKPTEGQSQDLKRVVDWAGQTEKKEITRAQRQAGWPWLIKKSLQWEEQRTVEIQSSGKTWWVPAKTITVKEFEFRFLSTPLEVWEEGQAMRHCAYDLVLGCETRICWVVSLRKDETRVATLELRRTGEKWWIRQLAGKANGLCTRAAHAASSKLLILLGMASGEQLPARS